MGPKNFDSSQAVGWNDWIFGFRRSIRAASTQVLKLMEEDTNQASRELYVIQCTVIHGEASNAGEDHWEFEGTRHRWKSRTTQMTKQYGEDSLKNSMKMAFVTSMPLGAVQDFVYQNVDQLRQRRRVGECRGGKSSCCGQRPDSRGQR